MGTPWDGVGLGYHGLLWDWDTIVRLGHYWNAEGLESHLMLCYQDTMECCGFGTPWNDGGISWIAVGLGYQGLLWDCFSSDPSCSPWEDSWWDQP